LLAVLALGVASFAAANARAAPITFNSALPVSDDEILMREQIIFASADDGLGNSEHQAQAIQVLGYGLSSKLAAFAALPIVSRRVETEFGEDTYTGLGDAAFFLRGELLRRDGAGRTFRLAGFGGLVLPTGDEARTGDGSVDAFAGVIMTAASTDWVFDTQLQYTANGEASGFERGDAVAVDASLQYRLLPSSFGASSRSLLFGVLETNLVWMDEDQIAGARNPNSGGTLAFVSPGLQFVTRRWIAEAAVQLPVATDLNGQAPEPNATFITGMRFNF
jgi:hypothetical protein